MCFLGGGVQTEFSFVCLFVCLLFRAAPAAYGSSQEQGQIGAIAAGLRHSHSNGGSETRLQTTPQLRQCWILNPLSKARDGTCILMDAGQIRSPLSHDATTETPRVQFF